MSKSRSKASKALAAFTKRALAPVASMSKSKKDSLSIDRVFCLEIFAASARQAAFYFSQAYGFALVAYRGPETGYPATASYVLKQGNITFVISSALKVAHPIAAEVMVHGTTVRDIALVVPDCQAFYYEALKRGAESAEAPAVWEDSKGSIKRAAIKTYGNVVHSLVETGNYKGNFWPGFRPYEEIFPALPIGSEPGLLNIDHVVGNVELGQMQHWVKFYEEVLGFREMIHFSDEEISTEYSALMSKVMSDGKGKIKFPINEPALGKRKSQIEEYLEFHHGPGVQHVALQSKDIIKTVKELKKRGVVFLDIPASYYEDVPKRIGKIKQDLKQLQELGILVDRDDDGYLLQIFTMPVDDRPTLFFEIIQREGAKGFGAGNFKALFEAIEREQGKRGNL